MSLLMGAAEGEQKAYENAGKIVAEATNNIRTVASLTREQTLIDLYCKELAGPLK